MADVDYGLTEKLLFEQLLVGEPADSAGRQIQAGRDAVFVAGSDLISGEVIREKNGRWMVQGIINPKMVDADKLFDKEWFEAQR